MTDNLLDLALNFEKQATEAHYKEAFGDDAWAAANVCDSFGVMALYEWIQPCDRHRFATYLTNRFAYPEFPDVEWAPIGEIAIIPNVDTQTEVIA